MAEKNTETKKVKATVIAAEIPSAIIINAEKKDVKEIGDIIQKLEANKDFIELMNEFTQKLNDIVANITGSKDDVVIVPVPTVLPETSKEYADLVDEYVKGLFGVENSTGMKQGE